jgi:hypothetical protein
VNDNVPTSAPVVSDLAPAAEQRPKIDAAE